MREILFRAKRKHKANEWVQGFYKEEKDFDRVNHSYISYYEIDKDTLGQFTGITDKSGTKIFEGDIIKYKDNGCLIDKGNVLFKDGCFFVEGIHQCYRLDNLDEGTTIEVIGTIYDNKDLIK